MTETVTGSTTGAQDRDHGALPIGHTIGRYEILAILGQGGFGITYRAHDAQLGREVAIKEYLPTALAVRDGEGTVLPRSTKMAEEFTWGRRRFVDEGRTLATLHGAPAIVRVFDFLEANGTAYIIMELVIGETLEKRLEERGPLTAGETEALLMPLLDGLEQVHIAGFLHRDIKPANILLNTAGKPILIDFGASRAAMAGGTVAMTSVFTPGYAASEQMTSAKQGPWTDIYSVAATFYHAIRGKVPPNAFERMLDDNYEPLGKLRPAGFAPGLLAGIDAGLIVRASDRPQSIAGWRGILSMRSTDSTATIKISTEADSLPTSDIARPAASEQRQKAPASAPQLSPTSPAVKGANRTILLGGLAATAALLLGGAYFLLEQNSSPRSQTVTVQSMKVEQLEQILAERRKAEGEAAAKQHQEDEARAKKQAEVAARAQANDDLAKAQAERQKVEQELADLKAEVQTRRTKEERQATEEAKRKAEESVTALRATEEEARTKAAERAAAKHKADEELDRAQAERKKADEEAAAKVAAEAEAKAKADDETRKTAEAEAERKTAEAAEAALHLTSPDRQRLQVALTSLGFDTGGSDGAFGAHTRVMIGAWQKARSQSATGFLNVAQQQALLKEAAPALARFDEGAKKAEEAKKKLEEDAKAKAAVAAPPPTPPPAQTPKTGAPPVAAVSPPSFPDGVYNGGFLLGSGPQALRYQMSVRAVGGQLMAHLVTDHCGDYSATLQLSATGQVTGTTQMSASARCDKETYAVSGKLAVGGLQLVMSGGRKSTTVTLNP